MMIFDGDVESKFEQENTGATAVSMRSGRRRPLAELPDILRNYLLNCGNTGDEDFLCANIKWHTAALRMSPGEDWALLDCEQSNYFPAPVRLVRMDRFYGGKSKFTRCKRTAFADNVTGIAGYLDAN
jgi:hypothetical protein